jgi:hypothetical protein
LANDGRREETVTLSTQLSPSSAETDSKLRECMDSLTDLIDSPQTMTILRMTALTLLELPEHQFDALRAYALLSYPAVREEAVSKLRGITPEFWSEAWNQERPQSTGPLYSEAQQNTLTRINLIRFWVEEWGRIPAELRKHVADLLGSLQ